MVINPKCVVCGKRGAFKTNDFGSPVHKHCIQRRTEARSVALGDVGDATSLALSEEKKDWKTDPNSEGFERVVAAFNRHDDDDDNPSKIVLGKMLNSVLSTTGDIKGVGEKCSECSSSDGECSKKSVVKVDQSDSVRTVA
jgi:hypothetical protein